MQPSIRDNHRIRPLIAGGLLIVAAALVALPGCSKSGGKSAQTSLPRVYVTRKSLEPDKLASIWLIKRFVEPNARFKFVADDVPLTNGIPFDTPEAEFRRYATLSCFESILQKQKIGDPAIRRLGEIIHDTEVNYWGQKRFAETDELVKSIRSIIESHPDEPEKSVEQSLTVIDEFLKKLQNEPKPPQRTSTGSKGQHLKTAVHHRGLETSKTYMKPNPTPFER